uniref:Uncharacterized protein n=1 Tax=Rhizophora mucronata TaxID=61149 RepID=A0A2P2QXW6_RHIMU
MIISPIREGDSYKIKVATPLVALFLLIAIVKSQCDG